MRDSRFGSRVKRQNRAFDLRGYTGDVQNHCVGEFLLEEVVESELGGAERVGEVYSEGEEGVALEGVGAGPEGGGGGFCDVIPLWLESPGDGRDGDA